MALRYRSADSFTTTLPSCSIHVPERTVNPVKSKWLDRLDNPLNGSGRKRDVVGVAIHETDVLAVRHDLDNVARQQRPFASRSTGPMQDRTAVEMTAAANERQALSQRLYFTFPEDNSLVGPHNPLPVVSMKVDRNIAKSTAPFDHAGVIMRVRNGDGLDAPHCRD